MRKQKEVERIGIESFIHSLLALKGFKRGQDYILHKSQLKINKDPIRGKLLTTLKDFYPEYNYYWETPKLLRWF